MKHPPTLLVPSNILIYGASRKGLVLQQYIGFWTTTMITYNPCFVLRKILKQHMIENKYKFLKNCSYMKILGTSDDYHFNNQDQRYLDVEMLVRYVRMGSGDIEKYMEFYYVAPAFCSLFRIKLIGIAFVGGHQQHKICMMVERVVLWLFKLSHFLI